MTTTPSRRIREARQARAALALAARIHILEFVAGHLQATYLPDQGSGCFLGNSLDIERAPELGARP